MIYIIYPFTYKDYITCIHSIRQNEYLEIEEELETYSIMQATSIEEQYQKMIEYLFKDKERISSLFNCFLEDYGMLIKEQLECIEFCQTESGVKIVYKHMKEHIFYLILYKKKIDIHLPYYILQDCIKIIKNENQKQRENIIIIPVVIYAGEIYSSHRAQLGQWFKLTTYDNNILELKYNLIDLLNSYHLTKTKNTILEELIYIEALEQVSIY